MTTKAQSQEIKFACTKPRTKSQRAASQLGDGLRILKWLKFRQDNKALIPAGKEGGFAAYQAFEAEWKKEPVLQMDLDGVKAELDKLGYTTVEINEIRSNYYEKKKGYVVKAGVAPAHEEDFSEEIPY
ncbi:MAG: hypothetical protein VKL42_12590 [Snowella sp.]|nr:hypothetical protein [Snowella sp.]